MAKSDPKEKCPKCGGTIHAKATDKSGKLYCQAKGCGNVWVPGMENMNRPQLVIAQLQKENRELKESLNKERAEVRRLTEELDKLKPAVEAEAKEMFS